MKGEKVCPQCGRIDVMRFTIKGQKIKISVCCIECIKEWASQNLRPTRG